MSYPSGVDIAVHIFLVDILSLAQRSSRYIYLESFQFGRVQEESMEFRVCGTTPPDSLMDKRPATRYPMTGTNPQISLNNFPYYFMLLVLMICFIFARNA